MLKTEVTTIRVTFVGLTEGDPPTINLHRMIQRPDGGQKPILMSIPIRTTALRARAEQELRRGDEIEVLFETSWDEDGIPKTLLDFSKAPVSQARILTAAG